MKVNVYIGNHGKKNGIEDILTILNNGFLLRGHEVSISDHLETNSLNIIIEEFTNYASNKFITDFKSRNPKSKIVLVLTEFVETRFFISSFNLFNSIFDSAKTVIFNLLIKYIRRDFELISTIEMALFLAYFPLFSINLFLFCLRNGISKKSVSKYISENHQTIYLRMRYLGLEKMLQHMDGVIMVHPNIEFHTKSSKKIENFGLIYPELDIDHIRKNLLKDKLLNFEITGSITDYRKKWIEKINRLLLIYGMQHSFLVTKARAFDEVGNGGCFSLHPPQSKNWKYSSPTRIFRAIQIDNSIPVVTTNFGQHPIEKIAVLFNGIDTLSYLLDLSKNSKLLDQYVDKYLIPYTEFGKTQNDALMVKIQKFYFEDSLSD